MVFSFLYLAVRALLGLLVRSRCGPDVKDVELMVLRHELEGRHLEHVLRVYVDRYNTQRPHRALELRPPDPDQPSAACTHGEIRRRDRLGGLLHEYHRAAA